MSDHLGKITFLDTPDVNGSDLVTVATVPAQLTNLVIPGTAGFVPPTGTTAQRSPTPIIGETRYNSTSSQPEVYSNGAWLPYVRVIQTTAGTIAANSSAQNITVQTAAPGSALGATLWTTTFTPLTTGSNLFIQYSITASAIALKSVYTALFNGTTCIGMTMGQLVAVATNGSFITLTLQTTMTTVSTAAITFTAKGANYNNTATTFFNQGPTGTFGAAMVSQWRILEII